jgi:magnesium transporter
MRSVGKNALVLQAWDITPESIDQISRVAEISDRLARASLVWVDLVEPDAHEIALLADEFELHPLWLQDAEDPRQRPKLEVTESHALLIGYAHDQDPADLPQVVFFISSRWLVSVRHPNRAGRVFEIEEARAFYERIRGESVKVGPLLYALLDDMVDGYFDTVDAAEEQIATIEQTLFEDEPVDEREIQEQIVRVRRALIELRRRVEPMRDVVLALARREAPWVDGETLVYLQDVLDHLLRVVDGIDVQRELLGNVVDAQLGLQANRMNKVMKKMTSWGAILIAATLIAGIYGMNFRQMPELDWAFGYPGALLSMLLVTGTLYFWFRHKDWL